MVSNATSLDHSARGSTSLINNGIDSITRQQRALPDVTDHPSLVPSETFERSSLDCILAIPDFDEFISKRLVPRIVDSSIFMPLQFRDLLQSAPGALQAAAQAAPETAELLGSAARLLFDGNNMHELLQMYRNALLQG
jgi:hypothetical protein